MTITSHIDIFAKNLDGSSFSMKQSEIKKSLQDIYETLKALYRTVYQAI